jgi:hypothetical protein
MKERQGCHWGKEKPVSMGVKGMKQKVVIDVESEDEEEEEDAPPPRKVARSKSHLFLFLPKFANIIVVSQKILKAMRRPDRRGRSR